MKIRLCDYFAPRLGAIISKYDLSRASEIRLTRGALSVWEDGKAFLLDTGAAIGEINETARRMCGGAVYSRQNSIREGFVTLPGGHRTGFSGHAVTENGKITHITPINALCTRIAREIRGAADSILGEIAPDRVYNTLILSPPGCGKTTILRDAARSLGGRLRVAIADERCEIAACVDGEPGCDIGRFTVVTDSCKKSDAMELLLRSMSPDVMITDEIGTEDDARAIQNLMCAGVSVICSAHASDLADFSHRFSGISGFERVVILSRRLGAGTVEKIIPC